MQIWEMAGLNVIRKTLAEVAEQGETDSLGHLRWEANGLSSVLRSSLIYCT